MSATVEQARPVGRMISDYRPRGRRKVEPEPVRLPARRCVGHNRDGSPCITILNQYNPGPLCLAHLARIQGAILS